MSIQFTEKSYILGLWYQETDDGLVNYLTAFWKEDGKWMGMGRKRIVRDERIFDGQDEKTWQKLTPKNADITENEIIEIMDETRDAAIICGLKTDQLLIQGDVKKFLELSKTKPWCHMKSEFIH